MGCSEQALEVEAAVVVISGLRTEATSSAPVVIQAPILISLTSLLAVLPSSITPSSSLSKGRTVEAPSPVMGAGRVVPVRLASTSSWPNGQQPGVLAQGIGMGNVQH